MPIVLGLGDNKLKDPFGLYGDGNKSPLSDKKSPGLAQTEPLASRPAGWDALVDTIIAEAGGEGRDGMAAVAHVIRNRSQRRGQSPTDVVTAPRQFEGYENPRAGSREAQRDPRMRAEAESILRGVFDGSIPDPTGGADHFHAGYVSPDWARTMPQTAQIGGHTFYRSGQRPPGNPEAKGLARLAPSEDARPAGRGGNLHFVHKGQEAIDAQFGSVLKAVSTDIGVDLTVTSGYRSPDHPVEARKKRPGEHSRGTAADISMRGMDEGQRRNLVQRLMDRGIKRFGIYKNSPDMLHVDMKDQDGTGEPWFMYDRTKQKLGLAPEWFQEMAKRKPQAKARPEGRTIVAGADYKAADPMGLYAGGGNPLTQVSPARADSAPAPAAEPVEDPTAGVLADLEQKEPGRYKAIDKAGYETWKADWEARNRSTGVAGDIKRLLVSGGTQLIETLDYLATRAFGETFSQASDNIDRWVLGEPVADTARRAGEKARASMTPEQQAASQKEWVKEERMPDGTVRLSAGPAWIDPRSYLGVGVESLPSTVATMGPSGLLARGAFKSAIARGLGERQAAAAAARTALVSGAVSEGILGGAEAGQAVRDQIAALPRETIESSEAVKELVAGGLSVDEAVAALSSDAQTQAFLVAGVATGAFGGYGDRFLAKIVAEGVGGGIAQRILRGATRGAVAEGVFEEAPQSAAQQAAQNLAVQNIDPSQPLMQGVPNAAAAGLAGGGVVGGGFGGVAGAARPSAATPAGEARPSGPEAPPASAPTPPAPAAPPAGPLARALEHGEREEQARVARAAPQGIPDGAPPPNATVQVDAEGIPPFMARVEGYEGDEALVFDATTGEFYQVPVDAITQIAAAPGSATPTPENIPENIPGAEPRAADIRVEPAPRSEDKPAAERFPGPPAEGESVIVDHPEAGRFTGRVEAWVDTAEGSEAVVRDDKGSSVQVPLDSLYVNKLTPKQAEAQDLARNPPVERDNTGLDTSTARDVDKAKVQFPDATHARVFDLGKQRRQSQLLSGKSSLDRDAVMPAEQSKLAEAFRISPQAMGQLADDYRYRVERAAKNKRSDLPITMHAIDSPHLARAQAEWRRAQAEAGQDVPEVPGDPDAAWWDGELTAKDRRTLLDRAGVKRSEKMRWGGFTPAIRKKLLEARGEGAGTAPVLDTVDDAANAAATSPTNDLPQPTQAQKEAGNYAMGHVRVGGMDISIENPAGSKRSGKSKAGKSWSVTMKSHYGYIRGTRGKDKDHIDVFVKPGTADLAPDAPVFVVDQVGADGKFDEHKVMAGWTDAAEARAAYLENYSKGWKGLGRLTPVTLDQFKAWLDKGDTTKPFAAGIERIPAPSVPAPGAVTDMAAIPGQEPAAQPADDDDEVVIRLTPKGPWDFNDAYPEPDHDKVEGLAREGRESFERDENGQFDPETVASVLDETLQELVIRHLDIEGARTAIAEIDAGKVKKGRDPEKERKRHRSSIAQDERAIEDTHAAMLEMWSEEAADALVAEAKRRADVERAQTDPAVETPRIPREARSPEPDAGDVAAATAPSAKGPDVDNDDLSHAGAGAYAILKASGQAERFLRAFKDGAKNTGLLQLWRGTIGEARTGASGDRIMADARPNAMALLHPGKDGKPRQTTISGKALAEALREALGRLLLEQTDAPRNASGTATPTTYDPAKDKTEYGDDAVFPRPKATADPAKGAPLVAPDEAARRLQTWKDIAKRVGRERDNSNKVIISLFDDSGAWSQPFVDAGYTVMRFDLAHGDDIFENLPTSDVLSAQEAGKEIVGVLSACPCTTFAGSGARWWESRHDVSDNAMVEKLFGPRAARHFDTPVEANTWMVHSTALVVDLAKPKFHALENPIGRIGEMSGLPKPLMRFDPADFGDPYTKRTQLWGEFATDMPIAPVDPVEGSKIQSKLRGDRPEDKRARSKTPEGFAYAFFVANDPDARAMLAQGAIATPPPARAAAPQVEATMRDLGALDLGDRPGDTAASIVLQRGRESGIEHLIAIDADGSLVQFGSGSASNTGMTPELWAALHDPKRSIVIHHNHPQSRALSATDMMATALPGVRAIYAHAHSDGAFFRGALTPAAIAAIRRALTPTASRAGVETPIEAALLGGNFYAAARWLDRGKPLYDAGLKLLAADKAVRDRLNAEHQQMFMMALRDAGWLEYDTSRAEPTLLANPIIREGYERTVKEYADRLKKRPATGPDRPADAVRHPGDLAVIQGRDAGATARPDAQRDASRRGTADQRPAEGRGARPAEVAAEADEILWEGKRWTRDEATERYRALMDEKRGLEDRLRGLRTRRAPAAQINAVYYALRRNKERTTDLETRLNIAGRASQNPADKTVPVPPSTDPLSQSELDQLVAQYLPKGWRAALNPDSSRVWFVPPGNRNRSLSSGTINDRAELLATLKGMQRAGQETSPTAPEWGSSNTLVTRDRAEEVRNKLREKLRGQLSAGIDPEILALGAELAAFHIEAGARRFGAFARAVAADMGTSVETLRPFLRAWYNAARDLMEDSGLSIEGMDDAETVRAELAKLTEGPPDATPELDRPGQKPLEGTPAAPVQGAERGGDARPRAERSGQADLFGDLATRGSRVQPGRGVGAGQGDVPAPAAGGQPTARSVADQPRDREGDAGRQSDLPGVDASQSAATPAADRGSNYTITDQDALGEGGAKQKFRQNVAAIEILRQLEQQRRTATAEEQRALAKWVGWGGLRTAFYREDGTVAKGWEKEAAQLRDLLSEDEYRAAELSTRNAHYTSPEVVNAIWSIARRLGFAGGNVLEPSVGAGNFIGLMPAGVRGASRVTGVELDRITGGIAKNLYPGANIQAPMGFQALTVPDGHFDLAIGNPPFGSEKLYDADRRELNRFSIHNYFFAKSIDGLRPGGVLAMVVTNYFMDAADAKARAYIAARADLLGAIRLPNNAFLKNAGTEVTTDIIVLQRRAEGTPAADLSWVEVATWKDKEGREVPLNRWFKKHPEMMLGEFGAYGTMYRGDEAALVARPDDDLQELLDKAIRELPRDVMPPPSAIRTETVQVPKTVEEAQIGSVFLSSDGQVWLRKPDSLGEPQAEAVTFPNEKAGQRVAGMIRVRDAFARLRRAQISAKADDDILARLRDALNKAYDAFVKANGPINADANKRLFRDDPTWPQISALEQNFDKGISDAIARRTGERPRPPSAEKAAIFFKRTQQPYSRPTSAASAKDALATVLADRGWPDLDAMVALYRKPAETIVAELGPLLYRTPDRAYETADAYLSGNVKKKLAEAIRAAETDPSFRRNVDALRDVIPADIEAVDIDVKPGAPWLPANHVNDFIRHISDQDGGRAVYSRGNARWLVRDVRASAAADAQWTTSRTSMSQVLEATLNGQTITVTDRSSDGKSTVNQPETEAANEKVEKVKAEWRRWLWQDDARREHLTRIYNDTFNTDVLRQFDGSHLTFPGKVGDDIREPRPHQKNFVWRTLQTGTALADHTVGAGKTDAAIMSVMEKRRIGQAKKPLIVVPNHLVGQWAADFIKLYPGARVLATTKKDFDAENRKRLFARITTGDWDAVIVAHSSFGRIGVSPEFEARFIQGQIADLEESMQELRATDGAKSRSVGQLNAWRAKLEEKLKRLLDAGAKDDGLTFDELGIDALYVDEAHEFKNLGFATKMNRVAGLGNPLGSQKAADLYIKVTNILERTGNRNVVFLTGTPLSNTMAEMFTVQRYLDSQGLRDLNIQHFDAWARVFGEVVTDWELSPSGQYKLNSRFAKFVNMPELMQRYLSFADVVTNDDIKAMLAAIGKTLPLPKVKGGKPQNVVVERSPDQARYIGEGRDGPNGLEFPKGSLVWRAENLPKGKPQKGDDNMLKVMSDARKAALDMRLIDPSYPDAPGSKVHVAADHIRRLYDKWNAKRGTQLVFIDLSTPKKAKAKEADRIRDLMKRAEDGDEAAQETLDNMSPDEFMALDGQFSVYDDLREKLIARGVPAAEIAFIHDANTDVQKEELFGRVRSGQVRILFGSTAKMGAGTNVQNRLVALHHLDAPWRPSDLEQRDGRGIRQGNELYGEDPAGFEIEILRYATKNTLDARQWQTIEAKARFIQQMRKGGVKVREVEDIGGEAANSAEMKAAASGNPLILEEMDLRTRLRRLEGQAVEHDREQHRIKGRIRFMVDERARLADGLDRAGTDAAAARAIAGKEFAATVDGKAIDKPKDFGAAILAAARAMEIAKEDERDIGDYGAFTLSLERGGADHYALLVSGADAHRVVISDIQDADATGTAMRVINTVRKLLDAPTEIQARIAELDRQVPAMERQIGPWADQKLLEDTAARHRDVLAQLQPKRASGAAPAEGLHEDVGSFPELPAARPDRIASHQGILRSIRGKFTDLQPSVLATIPLNYFAELARPNMTSVVEYLRVKRLMDAFRGKKHSEMDVIAQSWLKYTRLGKDKAKALADLMHESTLAGVDPSKTDPESRAKPGYADLRARFTALPPAGQALYGTVRDAYKKQARELDAILIDNVRKAQEIAQKKAEEAYRDELARIARMPENSLQRQRAEEEAAARYQAQRTRSIWAAKARLTKLRIAFESSRVEEPYFPLARFGRYFVAVRDVDGAILSFSRRERAADRDQLAHDMRKAYPGMTVEVGVMESGGELRNAMDPRVVAEIEEILGGFNVDPAVMDQIWQRYLQSMPDLSTRKRFIHRKGTPGFDTDALRAFSSHMFHAAHQMGRLKYGLELQELTNEVSDQARESDDPTRGMTLANELKKRHQWVMNPIGSSVAQVMTSAAFVWYLGTSPAAALVNMTQTPVLGIPILGARFGGVGKAAAAILRASVDSVAGRGSVGRANLTADEKAALDAFYESGLIDRTQAHDLAGVGETGVEYSPLRARVMAVISYLFHRAEVWNREVTALAAYRMAKAAGQDQSAAIDTAHDLTWKTHFDYSNASRPRLMQNDLAKVALVFRAHNINMLYRVFRDVHQSFKGESAQARREARYQLAGVLGMMSLFAGVSGVFGFNLAMAIAGAIFGDEDDPMDFELKVRKDVLDILGPQLGGVVLNGVPGHYLGISLTDRLGMPDLWFRSPYQDLQGKEEFDYWIMNSLGASVAMAGSVWRGVDLAMDGNVGRGVEAIAPKWARDLLKAYRYQNEGVTNLRGDAVVDVSSIDAWDVIAQALGFTPAKVAETYERNSALMNAESRINKKRQTLVNAYALAARLGDEEGRRAALEAIKAFNAVPLHRPVAIKPDTLKRSLAVRARNAKKREDGVLIENVELGRELRERLPERVY